MHRLLVVTLALLPTPALAQADTAPVATARDEPAKPKLLCRRETETGSIIGSKKICHSKAEWQAIDRVNAMNMDMAPTRPGNGRAGT